VRPVATAVATSGVTTRARQSMAPEASSSRKRAKGYARAPAPTPFAPSKLVTRVRFPPPASSSGWRYFGSLGRQRLVASVGSLHTFGQHLGSDLDLVLEAIRAERPDLAAGEGATVEHGHGGILLHFSNKVPRCPMFMPLRRSVRGVPGTGAAGIDD
jgi:hypothetical protein